MADKTDIVSKTFSLEIDTGQTRKVPITNARGRRIGERSVPITKRVSKLSTVSSYSVSENGTVSNVNSQVRQEVTAEQYGQLDSSVRSSITTGTGRGRRTKYYATLATRDGETNKYSPTSAVDTVLDDDTAKVFKKDIANANEGKKSQFSTVSTATQQKINEVEGIQPGSPKNQTGLSANAPAEPEDDTSNLLSTDITPYELKGKSRDFGNTVYPEGLSDQQDRILFTMYEYGVKKGPQRSDISDQIITGFGDREFNITKGTVTLPIQQQITDSNKVNWGEGELNPLQASLATALMNTSVENIGDGFNKLKGTTEEVLKNASGDIAQAARLYLIQEAIGAKGLLSRVTGGILNPNIELLFSKPALRPFNFKFLLTPRSQEEANRVKKIIRFFKEGMAVQETATDIFLKAPHVFEIKYEYGTGSPHPGLNKIKKCALTSCSVDYTPNNSYMTFEDGTMTAYSITMQFQELEPVTTSDYDNDTTQIGF